MEVSHSIYTVSYMEAAVMVYFAFWLAMAVAHWQQVTTSSIFTVSLLDAAVHFFGPALVRLRRREGG